MTYAKLIGDLLNALLRLGLILIGLWEAWHGHYDRGIFDLVLYLTLGKNA